MNIDMLKKYLMMAKSGAGKAGGVLKGAVEHNPKTWAAGMGAGGYGLGSMGKEEENPEDMDEMKLKELLSKIGHG